VKRSALVAGATMGVIVALAYVDGLQKFLNKAAKQARGKTPAAAAKSKKAKPAPTAAREADGAPNSPSSAEPASSASSSTAPSSPLASPLGPASAPAGSTELVRLGIDKAAQRAILSLSVNLVDKGEVIVVLRGRDVYVQVADLEGAGVHDMTGLRETIGGKVHVSLQSLAAQGLTYEFDERALALRLTVPTTGLGTTVIDLRTPKPPDIIEHHTGSAFLNYALRARDLKRFDAFGEAGAAFHDAFLYTQVALTPDGHPVRGLSNVSYAERAHLRRWIVGDTFAQSGLLGGGLFLGGASVVRDFDLDPYFYRFPSTGLAGAVTTPSTVDVYVNGTLIRREEISPGSFQLNNLPLPVGAGSARVVVRDAFGREQVLATPFYFSSGILKPGLSDYGFHAGFRRNNIATESFDYAPPVFLGRYRLGLTDALTAGARVEGTDTMASGGPTATLRTLLGEIEGAVAASWQHGGGLAASVGYTYLGRAASFGALGRAFSDRYTNLSLDPAHDRATVEGRLFAGAGLSPRVSLTGQVGAARYRDAGGWQMLGLLTNVQIHDGVNVFVTANRTTAATMPRASYDLFATLTVALPDRTTASAFYQQHDAQAGGGAEVQRPLPLGTGYGYRVRGVVGADNEVDAAAQGQTSFGRYEAAATHVAGQTTTSLTAAGGVVALGGEVYATRPVQQGFGVIQVPGVAGVRGYLNNQEVGRTDRNGNLLVPELIPYYGNRLGIADEDLPIDYRVGGTERLLAPPLRGGAVARFDVERVKIVVGSVALDLGGGRLTSPAYGTIVVRAGLQQASSPLGRQGEFYFENLRPGRFVAEVDSGAGACRFELDVPNADKAFVDVGRIKCAGQAGAPAPGSVPPGPAAAPPDDPPPPVEAAADGARPAKGKGKGKAKSKAAKKARQRSGRK